jgi:hypothetical protein
MKQINLYQSEFRPPKILLPARAMAISGAVFLAGLLALYAWDNWQLRLLKSQVGQVVQRAESVTRQVAANAPGARQADPNVALEAQTMEARMHALQQAQDAIANGELGSEHGYAAQFRALARTTSPGAWLTGVTLSDSGHAMDLRGRALTGADAAALIANLRREALFAGLSFAGLDVHPPKPEGAAEASSPPRFLEFALIARLAEPAALKSASGLAVAPAQGNTP